MNLFVVYRITCKCANHYDGLPSMTQSTSQWETYLWHVCRTVDRLYRALVLDLVEATFQLIASQSSFGPWSKVEHKTSQKGIKSELHVCNSHFPLIRNSRVVRLCWDDFSPNYTFSSTMQTFSALALVWRSDASALHGIARLNKS